VENQFEPLSTGEVLSVSESSQIAIGHSTFRVGELADALRAQLLEQKIGGLTKSTENWFTEEGVPCEALRFGADGWQSGRVRIHIEFCPSVASGNSVSSRQSRSTTAAPAVAPEPAPPEISTVDEVEATDDLLGDFEEEIPEEDVFATGESEEVLEISEEPVEDFLGMEEDSGEPDAIAAEEEADLFGGDDESLDLGVEMDEEPMDDLFGDTDENDLTAAADVAEGESSDPWGSSEEEELDLGGDSEEESMDDLFGSADEELDFSTAEETEGADEDLFGSADEDELDLGDLGQDDDLGLGDLENNSEDKTDDLFDDVWQDIN